MARLLIVGYEVDVAAAATVASPDNPLSLTAFSGTVSRDTSNQRTGNGCLKCDSTGSNVAAYHVLAPTLPVNSTLYLRVYFRFANLPGSSTRIMGWLSTSGVSVRLTSGGKLQLWKNNTTEAQIGSDSDATLATDVYYRIELKVVTSGGGDITATELQLDGVSVASTSGVTYTISGGAGIRIGWLTAPGASCVCYLDDVAYNDGTGASNNSWPGDGKVVLLVPVSDNAVGTGWTLGTGTAISSNGFEAENNTPPIGVADLAAGSDPKQIRNATANANVNYDANMTTYAAAGINPGDTVNAIIGWVFAGAPVATSAKTGAVSVVSNPAAASAWSGTFHAGANAGTFPTGWAGKKTAIVDAPSVTLGTSPVMRLQQVTSSTRIAMGCFMGMYVDYTPRGRGKPPRASRTDAYTEAHGGVYV